MSALRGRVGLSVDPLLQVRRLWRLGSDEHVAPGENSIRQLARRNSAFDSPFIDLHCTVT
jgi:hypothetical protein